MSSGLHDDLTAWWKQNKDETYWDEKRNVLVARGLTPADVRAELRGRI